MRTKDVEVRFVEKDKFGRPGAEVWLTRQNVYRIHEALVDRVQKAEDSDDSGIKEAAALADAFLKLHDQINPS